MITPISINSIRCLLALAHHQDNHAVVAINDIGELLGDQIGPATSTREQLLDWAKTREQVVAIGVEGIGTDDYGLTQFPRRLGLKAIEVSHLCHRDRRRLLGKKA
jgi:hypothetical protein